MAQATSAAPVFQGNAEEQRLAQRIFELMAQSSGPLFAQNSLIRQSVSNLAAFLGQQEGEKADDLPSRIDDAIQKNPAVFGREQRDGDVIVSTTRRGVSTAIAADTIHNFRERLYEPSRPLPVDDMSNIVTTVRPVIPAPEPILISAFWRGAQPEPEVVEAEVVADMPEAVVAPVVEPKPVEVVPPAPPVPVTVVVMRDGTQIDLSLSPEELLPAFGDLLQNEVRQAFEGDPLRRVVSFGDQYYLQDGIPTFGKNDLRRIRDFIVDQAEPTLDSTILTDLYRERPGTSNFEIVRFALNYRLSREKDFDYAGMPGANLWSAKGLVPIGGKRLKVSDLGQLLSYIPDGYDDSGIDASPELSLRTLTYFEWEYGILPLDAGLAAVLPQPFLADQRSAVIRLEYRTAQQYTSFLAEVRFPTGTRGGWVWGLEEFFHEYLVPGAIVGIGPTEEPNVFVLTYDEATPADAKVLHIDEKRNKFVFMPVTYYVTVDETFLPTQARYNKLRNLKMLPMSERKKAEVVLAHVFETIGEQLGSREEPLFWLLFNELYMAVNVLRPISQAYLTQLLNSDPIFYADETTSGAWYYKPVPVENAADAVEDEDEDAVLDYDEDEE